MGSTNYAMRGVELKNHEPADHSLHYANDLYMQRSFMLEKYRPYHSRSILISVRLANGGSRSWHKR